MYEESFPDLRYIVVSNVEGNPLLSTFKKGVPSDLLAVVHSRKPAQNVSIKLIRSQGELLYDYECRKAGIRVRVGLSLARAQELVRDTTAYVIWSGVIVLIGVFVIALRISRPLEALTEDFERVIRLDREISGNNSIHGTLEIATITGHFHELVARLEERTRQLDTSKKLAYLGQLSASIAHEVNNPLGVIVMNSDFLNKRRESGELGPDASKEVKRLYLAAKHATLSVQKLLQFTRHVTQGEALKYRPTHLNTLINETLELLTDRIQLSGCSVGVDIPEDLPEIDCDGQGIQQVLFNLVVNAMDASLDKGEIGIRVIFDRDNQWIAIHVSNRGEELTEEILENATNAFFTTKESGKGIGLGLAISNSIIKAHGGNLLLENQNQVTTATIKLPVKKIIKSGELA